MQLTAPFFLFLFLPLGTVLVAALPQRLRFAAISALSLLWFVLVNRAAPAGYLYGIAVVLMTYLFSLVSLEGRRRAGLTALGVCLPMAGLFVLRVLVEYTALPVSLPYGVLFLTLGCVCVTVDRARGGFTPPRNPLLFFGAVLYFPLLTAGPLLRVGTLLPLLENAAPSLKRMQYGVYSYAKGFVKRMIFAAPVYTLYRGLLPLTYPKIDPFLMLAMPVLALLSLLLFVWGTVDIARGISAMLGVPLPAVCHGRGRFKDPLLLLRDSAREAGAWISSYIYAPMAHRIRGKWGRAAAVALTLGAVALLIRTRHEMLLAALLLLPFLLPFAGRTKGRARASLFLLPAVLFAAACVADIALLNTPGMYLPFSPYFPAVSLNFDKYWLSGFMKDLAAIVPTLLLSLPPLLLWLLRRPVLRFGRAGVSHRYRLLQTLLVGIYFVIAVLYFLPRYPLLADRAMPNLYW